MNMQTSTNMTLDQRIIHVKHTIVLLSIAVGFPSIMKINDLFERLKTNSKLSDQDFEQDLNQIMYYVVKDITKLMIDELSINDTQKNALNKSLEDADNSYKNNETIEAKDKCIDIMNDVQKEIIFTKLK